MDRKRRSLVKGLTYRVLGTATTFAIAYVATEDVVISGGIGLGDVILKTGLYFGHERAWSKIGWGKHWLGTRESYNNWSLGEKLQFMNAVEK